MGGVYVVFGYHPCPVSFLHSASLSGFWHSATPTSSFIFNVFITLFVCIFWCNIHVDVSLNAVAVWEVENCYQGASWIDSHW